MTAADAEYTHHGIGDTARHEVDKSLMKWIPPSGRPRERTLYETEVPSRTPHVRPDNEVDESTPPPAGATQRRIRRRHRVAGPAARQEKSR